MAQDSAGPSSSARLTAAHGVSTEYRPVVQLDAGGMADLHLAVAQGPAGVEKLVVLKRLRPELASDEDYVAMFLEEARLSVRLCHPNVVQSYELAEDGTGWLLVLEFLEGQPLSRLRRKARAAGGIPLAIHLKILSEALAGLDYAHELADFSGGPLGIVHRDMNPQNIFVGYDGRVRIIDFGIAKAASTAIETRAGWLKGKLSYMSPEQVCGERVDRRADIFSVGAMLWEATTNRRLWGDAEEVTILRRMVNGDLPWLAVESDASPEVASICQRALAVNPSDRFQTAAEMKAAIDHCLDQLGSGASPDVASYVSELAGQEREALQSLVTAELARVAGDPTTVPVFSNGPESDRAPSIRAQVRPPSDPPFDRAPGPATIYPASLARTVPPVAAASRPSPSTVLGMVVAGGLAIFALYEVAKPPVSPSSRAAATAVPAAGAVTSSSEAKAERAPSVAPAPPVAQTVFLALRAKPSQAQLFLDGESLAHNPFFENYPADGLLHRIHAEAPGYLDEARLVRFDRDQALELALSPAAPPRAGSVVRLPARTPPAPPSPAEIEVDGRGPRKPGRRLLDPTDPWAH